MRIKWTTGALAAAIVLWSAHAQAVDFHIMSETIGQGYQLITSDGEVLKRHRLNQYLGFDAVDLTNDKSNLVSFHSRFRFDSDFGIAADELDAVDQLRNNNLSIMYAYVNVRRLAGLFDIRLGRQLIIDDVDFTMFDGLRFITHIPVNLGVEVYAGTEVKNAGFLSVISSTQLEEDGDGGYPNAPDTEWGIVMGGGIFLDNLKNHHGKIGYRRIQNLDGAVDWERMFANYHIRVLPQLHLAASAAWDFNIMDVSDILATVRAPGLAGFMDVEVTYMRLIPTFEGSSIFNVFSTMPLNDVNLRMRFHLTPTISTYIGGYLRMFGNDKDENDTIEDEGIKDLGGRVGGQIKFGKRGHLGLDVTYQQGYGDYTIFDLGGGYKFLDNTLGVQGRLTTIIFDDVLQEQLNGTSFGFQVGLSYKLKKLMRFHLMSELNTNKIQSIQYRLFGLIELDVWL